MTEFFDINALDDGWRCTLDEYLKELRKIKDNLLIDAFRIFGYELDWLKANSNRVRIDYYQGYGIEDYFVDDEYLFSFVTDKVCDESGTEYTYKSRVVRRDP